MDLTSAENYYFVKAFKTDVKVGRSEVRTDLWGDQPSHWRGQLKIRLDKEVREKNIENQISASGSVFRTWHVHRRHSGSCQDFVQTHLLTKHMFVFIPSTNSTFIYICVQSFQNIYHLDIVHRQPLMQHTVLSRPGSTPQQKKGQHSPNLFAIWGFKALLTKLHN